MSLTLHNDSKPSLYTSIWQINQTNPYLDFENSGTTSFQFFDETGCPNIIWLKQNDIESV